MPLVPGSLSLDAALGIGGYPKGRIIEMVLNPVVRQHLHFMQLLRFKNVVVKQRSLMQKTPLIHCMLKNLGVNIDDLILSQPDSGEQGLEIVDVLVRPRCH